MKRRAVIHSAHLLRQRILLYSQFHVIIFDIAAWRQGTVVWNGMKSTHSVHRHEPLSHELERANKWVQRSARAKRAVRSKRLNKRCKRMSERRSALKYSKAEFAVDCLPSVWPNDLSENLISTIWQLHFILSWTYDFDIWQLFAVHANMFSCCHRPAPGLIGTYKFRLFHYIT